jgi:hypothetical protein
LIEKLVEHFSSSPSDPLNEEMLVKFVGLSGKVVTGGPPQSGERFTEDTKSAAFINVAIKSAIKCPICNGFLDPSKSVSYDHAKEKAAGGLGDLENCQLTHPYCNQAFKNQKFHPKATAEESQIAD